MTQSRTFSSKMADVVIIAFLTLITFLCIAPILNTLAVSMSDKSMVARGEVFFWPEGFTLNPYITLMKERSFFTAFGISLQRVLLGGGLNFLLTVMMAYPLSKEVRAFKFRNVYMWTIVFTMIFNGGLIPWYMTIRSLHLIDTIWALVLPSGVAVFNVILLVNFFRSLPKELEEAANMDGAGPWYTLFRIYIPVSLPALATITLFSIVMHWNAFFDGLILMNKPDNYPLQTYIQQLNVSLDTMNISDPLELQRLLEVSQQTLNAAKIIVSMLPVLLVYPFLQKFFIHGIVMGSIKE